MTLSPCSASTRMRATRRSSRAIWHWCAPILRIGSQSDFEEFRRAFEAIRGERERLEVKLLQTSGAALTRLKLHCLRAAGADRRRPSEATMAALILDGVNGADR